MPFGLQPTHVIIIAVVALLIFGPARLPEIGRSIGKTLREFNSATKEASQGFAAEMQTPVHLPPAAPTAVRVACKSCGQEVQTGIKFCPECGVQQ